jgi:hypothetical protein
MTAWKTAAQSISTKDTSYVTRTLQQSYFNKLIDISFIIPLFCITKDLQIFILIVKRYIFLTSSVLYNWITNQWWPQLPAKTYHSECDE